jgi:transcriptional regulator with XRE-family HTH domain
VSKYPIKTLGQFLRKLRTEKGLERKELAKKLRMHKNTIDDWENDRHKPSAKSVERFGKFFKINRKKLEDFKTDRRKGFGGRQD